MNNLIFFTLCIVVSLSSQAQSIKLEELQKDDFIKQELYEGWKKSLLAVNKQISDLREPWVLRSSLYRLNRFTSLFNILPKDPAVVLQVFDEAVSFEANSFCESYENVIDKQRIFHPVIKSHLAAELHYMDSVCLEKLNYDSKLVSEVNALLDTNKMYRQSSFYDRNEKAEIKQVVADEKSWTLASKLISRVGYPGRSQVGIEYENVICKILFYQDKDTIESYLPLVKRMVENRELNSRSYPILYDRLCYLKNEPQYFGTFKFWNEAAQQMEIYEIKEKETVDTRRWKYNLWPLKTL